MRAREFDQPPAAGCILYAEDTGRWGFQQRSDSVTDPGVWSTWGGGREPGETLAQCVRRELAEESGYQGEMVLEPMGSNSDYATFVARVPREFEPRANAEIKDYCWVNAGAWPQPLHPDLARMLAEENLSEFAPSPDYRDDDDRQEMPLLEFAEIIKLFLGSEYTMVDHKRPEQVSVKFYPKDKTSGHNGAILYSLIGKQNEYPTVNFMLIDYEQGPEVGRGRKAGTAILKTRTNALKIADIIYNTMGLPAQDKTISENFADGKNPGRKGLAKRMGVPTKANVSKLRKIAKSSSGEKARMAHWMANMKAGKQK